ncbi:LOW QUALITY PROTEIN: putative leucine-rich repeat-containing protein DDB_G0290503 [Palaemon carinicauda]|uniref:LOW QUALITY PROTEIN: putative leucine-rich repeat-containing protein DDB_G0290503 n=1 Tax=Palaemon carinicauda TaxID=392227 RepID=UPI0035B58325
MSTYALSYNRSMGNGRARMYGNTNGLPGLPETRYMPLGGHPRRPQRPMPPPVRPPPAPPSRTNHPPPMTQPSMPSMPVPDMATARRIDMLEQRLNQTEQSNRTLLDELMRLQQELKMGVKKNEMGLVDEKESRNRLESSIREAQSRNYEIDDRIRRCEDGVKDVRSAVQMMSSHTKSVEKTIASLQQELMERGSSSTNRIQEYKHEIMKMNQSKEQMERLCFSLRDEIREAMARVDNLNQEMGSLESNVKLQGRLMEDLNNRKSKTPQSRPKTEDNVNMSETVRMALEGRMIQINTAIQDLTHRLNMEAKKREKVETDVNIRINELLEDYGSSKVEKDKEMREFDDRMKELQAGFSVAEKQRIQMEISSVAQELNRKIDEKEAKLRNDTVNKLSIIENTLTEENKRRAQKEKDLQEMVDSHLKKSQTYGDEGQDALKKHVDQNANQVRERLSEMNNKINDIDKNVKNYKLEHEKVMQAEIKQRETDIKELRASFLDGEQRQRTGLASLQAAIGERNQSARPPSNKETSGPDYAEIERMQQENADGIRKQVAKDLANIDKRLGAVETKVKQQDERLDNRLKTAQEENKEDATIMGDKIQQKVDSLAFSQERLKKQVDSLQDKVQDTPKGVTDLKDQMDDMDKNLRKKLDEERKERMDDVAELRGDVDRIIGKNEPNAASVPSLARLNQDIDETQTGMKKLGAAIHVVKERLDTKLKEEKTERQQRDNAINSEVERVKSLYVELNERLKKKTGTTSTTE